MQEHRVASDAPADPTAPALRAGPRWIRWLPLAPLVPAIASLVSAWVQGWVPVADGAVAAVRAADIARGHLPLLGMPASISEFTPGPQRYHPGPLLFWALAPFTWALGAQVGAAVGTVAINTAAAVGTIAAAARAGRPRITALATAATLLTGITVWGPGHLYDPFNTMVPALALLCAFVLAWRLSCGDGAMLPWAVAVASFAVQTHVVYAIPLLVTLGPAAIVAVGPRRWRPAGTHRPGPAVVIGSTVLALVLWSGPLLDAVRHRGGNLRVLAGGTDGTPVVGLKGVTSAGLNLFTLPPVQFTAISSSTFLHSAKATALVTLPLAVWAVLRTVRSGDAHLRRLLGVAGLTVVGGALTVALLPDEPLKGGQMTYFKVVATFVWLALLSGLACTWDVAPARRRAARATAAAALVILTAAACLPFPVRNGIDPDSWLFDATPALTADLDRALPHDRTYRMTAAGGARYLLLLYGLVAGLDARGRTIGVTPDRSTNYDDRRTLPDGPGVVTLHVQAPEVARPRGGRLVARFRPSVDRQARRRIEADLLRRAREHGRVRLTSNGVRQLGATLRGRAGIDAAEVRALQEDPSRILTLPAEDLAALYRNDWVIEPGLPSDLRSAFIRLLGPTAVDVWAVEGG